MRGLREQSLRRSPGRHDTALLSVCLERENGLDGIRLTVVCRRQYPRSRTRYAAGIYFVDDVPVSNVPFAAALASVRRSRGGASRV